MKRSLGTLQVEHDRHLLAGRPELLAHKWGRMARSPFGFFRGASALWAEALKRQPSFLRGIAGHGALVGDLHLENFGTFAGARGMTFHVNDFDETFEGPWAFDVLRLVTSTLLARPELHVTGTQVLALAHAVVDGHDAGIRGGRVARPAFITRLVRAAGVSSGEALLAKRLESKTRLRRSDDRWPDAPLKLVRAVPSALEQWRASLSVAQRPPAEAIEMFDCTRRIAGTGSIGVERLQVLTRGGLMEIKEIRGSWFVSGPPSAEQQVDVVDRVLPDPPLRLGAARLLDLPVVVKPVSPAEEKLVAHDLKDEDASSVCRYLGFLTGDVHRRGGRALTRWNPAIRAQLIDRAMDLAGIHEQAFLDFCKSARAIGA